MTGHAMVPFTGPHSSDAKAAAGANNQSAIIALDRAVLRRSRAFEVARSRLPVEIDFMDPPHAECAETDCRTRPTFPSRIPRTPRIAASLIPDDGFMNPTR